MEHNEEPDTPAKPIYLHGVVALLSASLSEREGEQGQLAQWTAVYGATPLTFDVNALLHDINTDGPAHRVLPAAMRATVEAVVAATSDHLMSWMAGHASVSNRLIALLADATEKSEREVIQDLEVWASEVEE